MSASATNTIRRKRHVSPKRSRRARDGEDDELDHPLHYVSDTPTFASAIRDGTITRPNLRRQLHTGSTSEVLSVNPTHPGSTRKRSHSEATSPAFSPDDWTGTPGSSGSQSGPEIQPSTSTREVLVHEVLPTDSLAGVALKYGIKVAALRKANKLWTSDTIHLRKVLYIPVEWQPSLKKSFISSDGDMHASDHTTTWATPTGSTPKLSSSISSTVSVVRRIPVSELSFFPPGTPLPQAASPPPPSAFPSSFDSHTSRPRKTQSVSMLNLFGNTIARMSTDSISSLTRTSMSDDTGMGSRATKIEVELDVAQNTWRTTPIPTHSPPPPTERLHAKSRRAPGNGDDNTGPAVAVMNRQPGVIPPMSIPPSLAQVTREANITPI